MSENARHDKIAEALQEAGDLAERHGWSREVRFIPTRGLEVVMASPDGRFTVPIIRVSKHLLRAERWAELFSALAAITYDDDVAP